MYMYMYMYMYMHRHMHIHIFSHAWVCLCVTVCVSVPADFSVCPTALHLFSSHMHCDVMSWETPCVDTFPRHSAVDLQLKFQG